MGLHVNMTTFSLSSYVYCFYCFYFVFLRNLQFDVVCSCSKRNSCMVKMPTPVVSFVTDMAEDGVPVL